MDRVLGMDRYDSRIRPAGMQNDTSKYFFFYKFACSCESFTSKTFLQESSISVILQIWLLQYGFLQVVILQQTKRFLPMSIFYKLVNIIISMDFTRWFL